MESLPSVNVSPYYTGETQWFPRDSKKLTFYGEGIDRTSVRVVPLHNEATATVARIAYDHKAFRDSVARKKGFYRAPLERLKVGTDEAVKITTADGSSWVWSNNDILPCERNPEAKSTSEVLYTVAGDTIVGHPSERVQSFVERLAGRKENLLTTEPMARRERSKTNWIIRLKEGGELRLSMDGSIYEQHKTISVLLPAPKQALDWTAALTHCVLAYRYFKREAKQAADDNDNKSCELNLQRAEDWKAKACVCKIAGGTTALDFDMEPSDPAIEKNTGLYPNEAVDSFRTNDTDWETGDDYEDAALGSIYDQTLVTEAEGGWAKLKNMFEQPQEEFINEPIGVVAGKLTKEALETGYESEFIPMPNTADGEAVLEIAEEEE